MALIVEDGSIVPGANSYIDVAFANTYHRDRNNSGWTGGNSEKTAAILEGVQYIETEFRFLGEVTDPETPQNLLWPRVCVRDRRGLLIDENTIPDDLKNACAEMALAVLANGGSVEPAVSTGTPLSTRERVGVVESERQDAGDANRRFYPRVFRLLSPYLRATNPGGGSAPIVRA